MAKAPENIEAFQRVVGLVLGRLYEIHPAELQFEPDGFFGDTVPSDKEINRFEDTVNYLVRHGYLHQDKQYFLQLTPASWEVLKQQNPLDREETLGSALVTWTKDTASETSKSLVGQAAGTVRTAVSSLVLGTVS